MSNIKVVNIDNLLKSKQIIRAEIAGKVYTRAEPTVSETMQTLADLEALTNTKSHLEAANLIIDIVLRSFRDLTRDQLVDMPADALSSLFDVARGDFDLDVDEKDEQGNEQPAA